MKKNYFTKLSWLGVALCAVALFACGVKIAKVTLSTNEVAQGGEVTVTVQFDRAEFGDQTWANNENLYLLYAIRVPEDWSAASVLEAVNNYNGTQIPFSFTNSPAYAALAELCYPLDGYKWIAFQSKEKVTVNIDAATDNVISTLTLKSGNTPGNYTIDVMAGSFHQDPSGLLNANGTVNVNFAFGNNFDFSGAETPKVYTDGGDDITMFQFSEYLVNSTTITPEEVEARKFALMDYQATVGGQTYPITPADITNPLTDEEIAQFELNVTVTEEVADGEPGDDTNAVKEIKVSENDNAPVYDLNGVKVANPTAPGIYVKNGKKFVIK